MSVKKKTGLSSVPFMLNMPVYASMLVATAVMLCGLVALYVETYNMAPPNLPGFPGDAFFPRVVLGFSMVWAVIILLRALLLSRLPVTERQKLVEEPSFSLHWLEFASVCVLVLLYAFLLEPVGFEITTTVFMLVLLVPRMLAGSEAKPAQAVLYALALSLAAMLILYAGLGPALKIGLPLLFLPTYLL